MVRKELRKFSSNYSFARSFVKCTTPSSLSSNFERCILCHFILKISELLAGLENLRKVWVFFKYFSVHADMFLQHLDTELAEEDVQKITSGNKAKAQITVLTAQHELNHLFS